MDIQDSRSDSNSDYIIDTSNPGYLEKILTRLRGTLGSFLYRSKTTFNDFAIVTDKLKDMNIERTDCEIEAIIKAYVSKNGANFLHIASLQGSIKFVQLCLRVGISIDSCDNLGKNCLHYATLAGRDDTEYIEVIKYLLSNGADMDKRDQYQRTPLDILQSNTSINSKQEKDVKDYAEAIKLR